MRPRSDAASLQFSHEPKGTSLRILADSEVVSGMDYGAVKLDHSLKSARHVIHNEIRQRECVARPGPAFMDTYLGRIGTSLPTLSFATLASLELNVQHTLPESEGALGVIGWKLDEGDGRAIHAPTIAALEEERAASAVLAMKRRHVEDLLIIDIGLDEGGPKAWAQWKSTIPGLLRDYEPIGVPLVDEDPGDVVSCTVPLPNSATLCWDETLRFDFSSA